MNFQNKITTKQTALISSIFVFGILVGLWIVHEKKELCFDKYQFVNKYVACTHNPVIEKTGYAETQEKIESYIKDQQNKGNVSEASVYFRDLDNGPVWGINELSDFAPASLLKLPLVLVYLTIAERDQSILSQKLVFTEPNTEFEPVFVSGEKLIIGQEYEIQDLLERALTYSDNDSYLLLVKNLVDSGSDGLITDTFLQLGILAPQNIYDEVVSVRRYASIFRALYNSSFIGPDLSDLVLTWLAQSQFKQGLPGKLPKNLAVAHKFGERFAPDGTKQLHDCGIIYYPANPYLLCVMTKGDDWNEMVEVISEISGEVYKEVDSRKISMIN